MTEDGLSSPQYVITAKTQKGVVQQTRTRAASAVVLARTWIAAGHADVQIVDPLGKALHPSGYRAAIMSSTKRTTKAARSSSTRLVSGRDHSSHEVAPSIDHERDGGMGDTGRREFVDPGSHFFWVADHSPVQGPRGSDLIGEVGERRLGLLQLAPAADDLEPESGIVAGHARYHSR